MSASGVTAPSSGDRRAARGQVAAVVPLLIPGRGGQRDQHCRLAQRDALGTQDTQPDPGGEEDGISEQAS